MVNESQEAGVAAAIVERIETQRLPRAIDLKEKVDQGGVLDDFDIDFLDRVFADTNELRPFLTRHPEYQALAARMMNLYHEITEKALSNEPKLP
ncbi:hypothetical protein [Propionivibrio sp.]|uniref:hypothetical protein n=1 Tax=Propionivibrio sp. TaxID=2212460 RepID=UPI0026325941|nr:hypothetical protein [Propionivibrio sp.]